MREIHPTIQHFRELLDDGCRISVKRLSSKGASNNSKPSEPHWLPYWQWVEKNVEDAYLLLGYRNPRYPHRIGIMAWISGKVRFFSVNPRILKSNDGSDFASAMKECYHLAAKHLKKFSWFRDLREVKRRKGRKRVNLEKSEVTENVAENGNDSRHFQKDAYGKPVNKRVWQPHPAETYSNSVINDPP